MVAVNDQFPVGFGIVHRPELVFGGNMDSSVLPCVKVFAAHLASKLRQALVDLLHVQKQLVLFNVGHFTLGALVLFRYVVGRMLAFDVVLVGDQVLQDFVAVWAFLRTTGFIFEHPVVLISLEKWLHS